MKNSPRMIAVMTLLVERGPANRLDIERALGAPDMTKVIAHLKRAGLARSRPKKRLEPVQYELTPAGVDQIRLYLKRQNDLCRKSFMDLPQYVPPPDNVCMRPGAMRAFQLPSRGIA